MLAAWIVPFFMAVRSVRRGEMSKWTATIIFFQVYALAVAMIVGLNLLFNGMN